MQTEQLDDLSAEFCAITPAGLLAVLPNPGDAAGAVTAAELFAAEDLDLTPLPDDRVTAVAAGSQGLIGRMQALQLRAVNNSVPAGVMTGPPPAKSPSRSLPPPVGRTEWCGSPATCTTGSHAPSPP